MNHTISHWSRILLSASLVTLAGCSSSDTDATDDASGDPAMVGEAVDDLRAPTFSHHGAGTLQASMAEGQPSVYCPYRVVREGDGNAVVTVTKPDQSPLVVRFADGAATSVAVGDPPQSATFSTSRKGSLNVIQVGKARYGIPDYVVYGD